MLRPLKSMEARSRKYAAMHHAFTLIELLVVVAIITMLIAILIPSLANARSGAKQTACLSNLRQIGTAMLIQAQEHQQYTQISGYIHGVQGTPDGLSDSSMTRYSYYMDGSQLRPLPLMASLAPLMGQQIRTDTRNNMSADANTGLIKKIFTCPADPQPLQGITGKASGWSTPPTWSSYGFNECLLGWSDPNNSSVVGFSFARGRMNNVASPAETFFLCDCIVRNGSGGWLDFYANQAPSTLAHAFYNVNSSGDKSMFDQARHRGQINVLFADGHGTSHRLPAVDSVYRAGGPLSEVFIVAPQ